MYTKCFVVGCNRIAWFDCICPKCKKEAEQIMQRIGQSRNSGNRQRPIIGPVNYKG